MPRSREDQRRYDASPTRRAKDAERSRRRYWSDPEYREAQRQRNRQRARQPTPTTQAKNRQRKLETRQQLRRQIGQIKIERGCIDCGYTKHPVALQFDHVEGKKVAIISKMIIDCVPWIAIVAEIAKCEVRCANCHAIRTFERLQEFGKPSETDIDLIAPEQLMIADL